MRLEQEAAAFSGAKQTQFKEGIQEYLKPLVKYVEDNTHSSEQRDEALKSLTLFSLWSQHCAETHGIK